MTAAPSGTDRRRSSDQRADEVDELVPLVYEQLRRIARRHLAGQQEGHSLQTADLLDEAYLKLAHRRGAEWGSRAHFVAVASHAMRCVLVDHARRRGYAKRGRNPIRVSLTEGESGSDPGSAEVIAVHEALTRLAQLDPRKSRIVELRYFGGLGDEEIAEAIGLSTRTVRREWRWAKAWLYRELGSERSR
jgi:RNA polymerase sigma factor (TIGR02999 family)